MTKLQYLFQHSFNRFNIANKDFDEWKNYKLYPWQYKVLSLVMEQSPRKVLWVKDLRGDVGKSFLASYLCNLYGFDLFDGVLSPQDLAPLINFPINGFVFDVSRDDIHSVNYSSLESLKNGSIILGKYGGRIVKFSTKPVVTFANGSPDEAKLSMDHWQIVTLGENEFSDLTKTSVVSPSAQYSFVRPPPVPQLSENLSLRDFLKEYLDGYEDIAATDSEEEEDRADGTSLIQSPHPGPSRLPEAVRPVERVPPETLSEVTQIEKNPTITTNPLEEARPSLQSDIPMYTSSSSQESQSPVTKPVKAPSCLIHPDQGMI